MYIRVVVPLLITFTSLTFAGCTSCASSTELDEGVDTRDVAEDIADVDLGGPSCPARVASFPSLVGPTPGELYYVQIGLSGLTMGEAALVVGPDGTVVLIDAGNDRHASTIIEVLDELHEEMEIAGHSPRPARTIDHAIITHLHADHADGLDNLLADVGLTGHIIHRGLVDLNGGIRRANFEQFCNVIARHRDHELALCEGPPAPCDGHDGTRRFPSTGCDGLHRGNLLVPGDSGPAYLPLGEGRIDILGVNGIMAGERYLERVGPFAEDHNGENARSIVGSIAHGPFRMLFTGDLTSGDRGDDDMEGFYAPRLSAASDIGALGVDVIQAGHHGRRTSNSMVWMDRLAPNDGKSRNVVMGISSAHVRSPHQEVLDNILHGRRLRDGRIWATTVATMGATAPELVDAEGGRIVVATFDGGRGYVIQALSEDGAIIASRAYPSVGCASY